MIKGFLRIFGSGKPTLRVRRPSRFIAAAPSRRIVGATRSIIASITGTVIARVSWLISQPRMATGFVVALIGFAFLPIQGRPLAAQGIQSVLDLLNARSPGPRGEGRLTDTKLALAGVPRQRAAGKIAGPPRQRALGKIFAPPAFAPIGGQMPFPPNLLDVAGVPGVFGATPFGDGGGGGGSAGGISAPGGGGGTPGGGGGTGSPPVTAVPEPATWLMMIIAFSLCGVMLRRQRRASAFRSKCKPAG